MVGVGLRRVRPPDLLGSGASPGDHRPPRASLDPGGDPRSVQRRRGPSGLVVARVQNPTHRRRQGQRMTTYFKATRPGGKDFRSGTVDYGDALNTGAVVTHP